MRAPAGDARAPVSLVPSGLPVRRLEISLNHWVKNSISLEDAFLKTVFSDCVSLNLFPVVSRPLGHRSLCVKGKHSPIPSGLGTTRVASDGTDPSSLVQLRDGVATGSSWARTESLPASVGRRGHSGSPGVSASRRGLLHPSSNGTDHRLCSACQTRTSQREFII